MNGWQVLPLWGSLRPHDQESVQTLLKRLAGHGSQEAVSAELMQFISAGFAIASADFAAAARVCSVIPVHCICCFAHISL